MSDGSDDPIEGLQREVERLFRDLVYQRHPTSHFIETPWSPPTDLVFNPTSARILLELAGVPRENIHVRLRGRTLMVSGRRDPPQDARGAHYHRAEIYFGVFHREVELPWEPDPARVKAYLNDGLLEIRLKSRVSARRTRVRVASGEDA